MAGKAKAGTVAPELLDAGGTCTSTLGNG